MAAGSDRPGARTRAATLRIKRGAKTLSEIALGRAKLVVGGGATAQLRLKNAGLPDECIVLDTRETPFKLESRLGPDQVLVNGWAVETATVRPGDRIEFSGITLELIAPEAEAKVEAKVEAPIAAPPPAPRAAAVAKPGPAPAVPVRAATPAAPPAPQTTDADVDPYVGRQTAARMRLGDLERAAEKLRADRESPSRAPNDPTDADVPAARARPNNATERDLPPPRRARSDNGTERDLPPARPRTNDATDHEQRDAARPASAANRTERDLPPPVRARGDVPTEREDREAQKKSRSPVLDAIEEAIPRTGFSRPPWLESVGDPATAGAKLYLLQSVVVVGRQGDLRVNHPSVSKKHARFSTRGSTLLLEDQGSTNGTWINRERLTAPRALSHGDVVHFGAAEFKLHIPGVVEEASRLEPIADAEPSSTAKMRGMPFAPMPDDAPIVRGTAPGTDEEEEPADPFLRKRTRVRAKPVAELSVEPPAAARNTEREIPRDEVRRRVDADPLPRGRNATEREIPREEVRRELNTAARLERDRPTIERPASRRPAPVELTPDPELSAVELDEEPVIPAPSRARSAPVFDAPTFDRPPSRPAPRARRESARDALPPAEARAPRPSRAPVAIFAVGALAIMMTAGGVGTWAAWPKIQALIARPGLVGTGDGGVVAATPKPRATPGTEVAVAATTARPRPTDHRATGRATPAPTLVAVLSTPVPTPTEVPSPTLRPGQSLFGNDKIDLGGDNGRLNSELATLEQGSNNNRLRAEREINADVLHSIFVGDGDATIRREHKEDGFTMAPSAADAADAEDRKLGAKQISGDKVNQLIRAHFSEVKQCLVGGRFKGGRARVVVQFTIQPTGKVGDSRVIESDVAGAGFQSCVAGIVRRITFPKPKEQSVIVQFPFVFTLNN